MPINVLPKDSPRGKGPEPSQAISETLKDIPVTEEEKLKEGDQAALEIQALWESQEIGITGWSESGSQRYSDPE